MTKTTCEKWKRSLRTLSYGWNWTTCKYTWVFLPDQLIYSRDIDVCAVFKLFSILKEETPILENIYNSKITRRCWSFWFGYNRIRRGNFVTLTFVESKSPKQFHRCKIFAAESSRAQRSEWAAAALERMNCSSFVVHGVLGWIPSLWKPEVIVPVNKGGKIIFHFSPTRFISIPLLLKPLFILLILAIQIY